VVGQLQRITKTLENVCVAVKEW